MLENVTAIFLSKNLDNNLPLFHNIIGLGYRIERGCPMFIKKINFSRYCFGRAFFGLRFEGSESDSQANCGHGGPLSASEGTALQAAAEEAGEGLCRTIDPRRLRYFKRILIFIDSTSIEVVPF